MAFCELYGHIAFMHYLMIINGHEIQCLPIMFFVMKLLTEEINRVLDHVKIQLSVFRYAVEQHFRLHLLDGIIQEVKLLLESL